ncbi:right-handed parallel beta-helix repeat-containing protein [Edaphocola flava]|uniref:right-handed parallel beta-helix repeat-containing protein n=1 Tax=Edaphocola flava TaxID=2499629 RepID=UPI00100B0E70|nr:right-handed parallel beta-helix repeat-containing protein [Edaphocola flava]
MPTPSENPATYLIELDAFNITKDWVPQKPYTTSDYAIAKNNVDGINAALDYAVNTLNASIVKLPKGIYTFTFLNRPQGLQAARENNTCVAIPSNTTFDLSGCRIEMMYDSVNRSPYDNSGNPVYKFYGFAFGFYRANNAKIIGGEILGDVYQRSFVSGEVYESISSGIIFDHGSRHCSVENTTIRGFMREAIIISNTPVSYESWNPVFSKGDLLTDGTDNLNYVPIDLNNTYKTNLLTLSGTSENQNILSLTQADGNTLKAAFYKAQTELFWYDSNQQLIAKETNQVLEEIKRPVNAQYLRIVTYNYASNDANVYFNLQIAFDPCSHFTVKNCEFVDNHLGGISGGTNHTLIESCKLYNNGLGWREDKEMNGYGSGYQINFGGSFCLDITVNNCDIGEHKVGIVAGSYNTTITNNRFYNLTTAILIADANMVQIHNNQFEKMTWAIYFNQDVIYAARKVNTTNNYFSNFVAMAFPKEMNFINNHVENGRLDFTFTSNMKQNTFLNCNFNYSNFGPEIADNIFENKIRTMSYFQSDSTIIRNNTFKNYILQCLQGNRSVITFNGCTFDNTAVAFTGSSSIAELNYINCTFKNGTYHFNGFYGSPPNGAYPKVLFEGSTVYLSNDRGSDGYDAQFSPVGLVGTYNNNPSMFTNEIILKNSTIYLTGGETATVFGSSFGYGYTSITLENVTIKKEPSNTTTPTFRWYNAIVDNAITVRNGIHIGDGITYTGIPDAKFKKNTIAPERLPNYIGEEYIWFDAAEGTTNILKGINTNNLATAWAKVN